MKKEIKLIILIIVAGCASLFAQCPTYSVCPTPSFTWMQNGDLKTIAELLNRSGGLPVNITSGTGTVSTNGNWYRQDSATSANNFNREYLFSIDNQLTTLNNFPFTRSDSATANYNGIRASLWENITGDHLQTGDILFAGLYAGSNIPAPYNSVFKDANNTSLFSRWGSFNSYFIDTVAGSRKSTAEHLRLINNKLAGTLTVSTTGTASVTVSNTVTVNSQLDCPAGYTQKLYSGFVNTDNQVLYTVTAGKTFYLTSYALQLIGTANAGALIAIQDNSTVKISGYCTAQVSGSVNPTSNVISQYYPLGACPSFGTNVKFHYVSGSNAASSIVINYVGCESN